MERAPYTRLFADPTGESHFQEVECELLAADFAPPAAPLFVAGLFAATQCGFVHAIPGWEGEIPHPSPRRQFFCLMRGEFAITASDGTTRHFREGQLLLLEDTEGKGHSTRIIGPEGALVFTVALAG